MGLRLGNSRAEQLIGEIRELRCSADRRHDASERRFEELLQQNRDEIQLTREVVRRNEISFREQREVFAELAGEMGGLREDVHAMREGLFSLIDELRGGGPNPAAS